MSESTRQEQIEQARERTLCGHPVLMLAGPNRRCDQCGLVFDPKQPALAQAVDQLIAVLRAAPAPQGRTLKDVLDEFSRRLTAKFTPALNEAKAMALLVLVAEVVREMEAESLLLASRHGQEQKNDPSPSSRSQEVEQARRKLFQQMGYRGGHIGPLTNTAKADIAAVDAFAAAVQAHVQQEMREAWYASDREHDEHVRVLRAAVEQRLTEAQAEIERLQKEIEREKAWSDTVTRGKSPGGHWSAHAHAVDPDDKGKEIQCWQCRAEKAEAQLAAQPKQKAPKTMCQCGHLKAWHNDDGSCPMPRTSGGGPCFCVKFSPTQEQP